MSSSERAPENELELKLTEDDFRAMREARRASQAMSHEEYVRFLAQFHYSYEELAARKGPGGERFSLD